jgi:hypothetical protein
MIARVERQSIRGTYGTDDTEARSLRPRKPSFESPRTDPNDVAEISRLLNNWQIAPDAARSSQTRAKDRTINRISGIQAAILVHTTQQETSNDRNS